MSKLKKLLVAAGVSMALGTGIAQADPVTFLPSGVDVQFKYNNLESPFVTTVGQELFGLVIVTSIGDPSGFPLYWASGLSDTSQLNGTFDGLMAAQILPNGSGGFNIWFTGGELNLYNVPGGSYSPTGPLDPLDPQACGGPCPAAWLTADFAAGSVLADNLATPLFDESTATLFSTVSSLVSPLTGTGDGRLELTGGTAAGAFVDAGPGADFTIQSNLESCIGSTSPNCRGAGTWPIASFDPVVGATSTVPEPGSLLLLGLALAGMGVVRRRRHAA